MQILIAVSIVLAVIIGVYVHWRNGIDVRFGILATAADGGDYICSETRVIPKYPRESGFRYGLWFKSRANRSFTAYVVHYFPRPPLVLGGDLTAHSVRDDVGISPEKIYSVGGVRVFSFSEGDPFGSYVVKLFVNSKQAAVIHYDVVQPNFPFNPDTQKQRAG